MKTKTFAKKLSFNKQTITSLDIKEMNGINAGEIPTGERTCPDWFGCPAKNMIIIETLECF